MGKSVRIIDSEDVMVQFGNPETVYRGRWQNIRVTDVGPDENTPIEVRRSLVGLIIPTIFTKESIEKQTGATFPTVSPGSRLAYILDVVSVLDSNGKAEAAEQLRDTVKGSLELSMYAIEPEIYELVK